MKYGPYVCIGTVLVILFVLWVFWGGKDYDFIGLAPLSPETCGSYTGSLYNWGNITPATAYDPIKGNSCIPPDIACKQESGDNQETNSPQSSISIDNTPRIPQKFQDSNDIPSEQNSIFSGDSSLASDKSNVDDTESRQINANESTEPICTQIGIPRSNNTVFQPKRRFISRGERLCCQTMERIYGVPFTTIRPDWLRNPETGARLELDCYNDELKLAVEYNGVQHYKWPNFTNQTYQQFINQVRRDTFKINMCDKNGVYLIIVPYNVPHDKISSYIMSHLPETIQKRLREEKILS